MIIKSADDKTETLKTLQALLLHPDATSTIKKSIEQQIKNIKAGAKNETDVAFDMAHHFGSSENWMIIHDLRIEYDGEIAQIDHLILNRLLEAWVCESKHFSEGVAIDEHGGFTSFYAGKPQAIASPIEQNNRHVTILKRLFDAKYVSLPTRLGFTIKPDVKSLVLISNRARISRPKEKIQGMESVIKSEQFHNTVIKAMEDASPLVLAKLVGKETLVNLAKEIARLHTPIDMDWHARFCLDRPSLLPIHMRPQQPATAISSMPVASLPAQQKVPSTPKVEEAQPKAKQKLICASCDTSLPYNVAKFCWFNKEKFAGKIYCVECQKKF
jgi:hypothetical protein